MLVLFIISDQENAPKINLARRKLRNIIVATSGNKLKVPERSKVGPGLL